MEKYIILTVIASFLIFVFFEQKVSTIMNVKKYYKETKKLFEQAKKEHDLEFQQDYVTLLYCYKTRLAELKKEHPFYYKISDFFRKV